MDFHGVTDRMLRQPVYGIGFAYWANGAGFSRGRVIVFLPAGSCLAYRFCIFGDGCAL
jgi:hypothetical protein